MAISFVSNHSTTVWNLVNVYGPCCGEPRSDFTSWMFELTIPDGENWLLLGDFNFVRSPSNRNMLGENANDMLLFNEQIRARSRMELPIEGRSYTWSNMKDEPLLEYLDCFTSSNWTSEFPNTMVLPLDKATSDHIPCVVNTETIIPKSKIFRFENY